jgi:hypothetical protein
LSLTAGKLYQVNILSGQRYTAVNWSLRHPQLIVVDPDSRPQHSHSKFYARVAAQPQKERMCSLKDDYA